MAFTPRRTPRLSRDMGRPTTTNPSKDPRPLLPHALQWLRTSSLAKCLNSAPGRPANTLNTTRAGALLVRGATCESHQSYCTCPPRRGIALHAASRRKVFPDSSFSFHDYLRLATRGSSPTTNPSSLASSTCSSLRSSPVPTGRYQPASIAQAPALRAPREFSLVSGADPIFLTCSFLLFEKIIHSLPAPLAGRPTSRFDWATPIWDMSPLQALKCSWATRR